MPKSKYYGADLSGKIPAARFKNKKTETKNPARESGSKIVETCIIVPSIPQK